MIDRPSGWILAAFLPFVLACGNDTKNATCTPDAPDRATSPDCIYGDGARPLFDDGAACPAIEGEVPSECPSFYDVLDVLADPQRGNCTSLGCHGAETGAQTGVFLPVADPAVFYEELLDAEGSVGRPYVVADASGTPENESLDSWMVCNLLGEHGGGFPMPPPSGLPDPADVEIVRGWLLCGAPAPVPCPEDPADDACVACAKSACCPKVVQCTDDAGCLPCGACLQGGDLSACTAECDLEDPKVDGLVGCVSALCSDECPGIAQ